jgi:hypothetical protein
VTEQLRACSCARDEPDFCVRVCGAAAQGEVTCLVLREEKLTRLLRWFLDARKIVTDVVSRSKSSAVNHKPMSQARVSGGVGPGGVAVTVTCGADSCGSPLRSPAAQSSTASCSSPMATPGKAMDSIRAAMEEVALSRHRPLLAAVVWWSSRT